MPVLGGNASGSAGISKRGVYLPSGWNANWKAAREASGSTLAEVVIFGDSTTYGACITPGYAIYTWINRLRQLAVGAGYQDGGPGIVYDDLTDTTNYDGIVYRTAKTGMAGGVSYTVTPGSSNTVVVGDEITFQGRGTKIRVHYTKQPEAGSFTYSVDGGAPVTVNANAPSAHTADTVTITGLTDAVHTIRFVNLGGGTGNAMAINADFIRSAGIVFHKNAISGNTSRTYFDVVNPAVGAFNAQLMLGVAPGVTGAAGGFDWGMAKLGGNYRKPALAISAVGINDLQGLPLAAEGGPTTAEQDAANRAAAQYENNLLHFVRLARAADADPLIVVPHFDMALHGHTWGGQFIRAAWAVGIGSGCAVVDFNEAIRPLSTMVARGLGDPGVHAAKPTYDAEADFLWTQALSL